MGCEAAGVGRAFSNFRWASSNSRFNCSACCCNAATSGLTPGAALGGGATALGGVERCNANQPAANDTVKTTTAPAATPTQTSGERPGAGEATGSGASETGDSFFVDACVEGAALAAGALAGGNGGGDWGDSEMVAGGAGGR